MRSNLFFTVLALAVSATFADEPVNASEVPLDSSKLSGDQSLVSAKIPAKLETIDIPNFIDDLSDEQFTKYQDAVLESLENSFDLGRIVEKNNITDIQAAEILNALADNLLGIPINEDPTVNADLLNKAIDTIDKTLEEKPKDEVKPEDMVPPPEVKSEAVVPPPELKSEDVVPPAEEKPEDMVPPPEVKPVEVTPPPEVKPNEDEAPPVPAGRRLLENLMQRNKITSCDTC
eukprot:GHVR01161484.1.p1 GENE.GHVR01161484.1~~GHVR01161484.1.p1  ORF type:complete len:232 (+),score=46.34 GHVR01161484.1:50-745(+)